MGEAVGKWMGAGVDLRLPLKPMVPADDQEIALPCASVMVIMVLLNVAFTCATPEVMFLRSRRRMRCGSRAITENPLKSSGLPPEIGRASCRERVCQYV